MLSLRSSKTSPFRCFSYCSDVRNHLNRHHSPTQTWTSRLHKILGLLGILLRNLESLNFIDLPLNNATFELCYTGLVLLQLLFFNQAINSEYIIFYFKNVVRSVHHSQHDKVSESRSLALSGQ